jgi:glycosyltransferase involved in cell wall biosynthesis
MNIVFITDQPVPYGKGPTSRMLSLGLGMIENNNSVHILVLNPTEKKDKILNKESIGTYKGLHYKYLSQTTINPGNTIKKTITYSKGLLALIPELRQIHQKMRIDAIIMLHTWSFYPLWISSFVKKLKIIFLHERNEYPFLLNKKNLIKRLDLYIYLHFVLRQFDGLILITKKLENYYSQFLRKNSTSIVVPIVVEPDRFGKTSKDRQKYIAYCGDLGGNKDGVYNLLEAFSKISQELKEYRLYIIGDTKDEAEKERLKQFVIEANIEDQVIFTGYVSRENLPELLDKATVLALARPGSIQADGGFPTKLGEYLATGNPVVVTRVGEIPEYLNDEVNAYLTDPDDVDDFAEKLKQAIYCPQQSSKIGQNGQKLAFSIFNNRTQSKKIIKFIEELKKPNKTKALKLSKVKC